MRAMLVLGVLLALAALLLPWGDAEAQLDPPKTQIICQDPGDCQFVLVCPVDGGGYAPCSFSSSTGGSVSIPVPVPVVGVDAGPLPDGGQALAPPVVVMAPGTDAVLGSGFTALEAILAGLGTEATLSAILGDVGALTRPTDDQLVHGSVTITGTVPLPSGAATSVLQGTGNTSLSSIDTKIPANPATDRTTAAAPFAVELAYGGLFFNPGVLALDATVAAMAAKLPGSLGQKAMAASLAVTLASDQPALPLASGAATSTLQGTGNTSLSSIDSHTPALGQAANAGSSPTTLSSDQIGTPETPSTSAVSVILFSPTCDASYNLGEDGGLAGNLFFPKRTIVCCDAEARVAYRTRAANYIAGGAVCPAGGAAEDARFGPYQTICRRLTSSDDLPDAGAYIGLKVCDASGVVHCSQCH